MKKIIQPGSGVDDMGGGIASGCFKWVAIMAALIFLTFLTLLFFGII